MKNLSLLIDSINKSNFVDLYCVVDAKTFEIASILFVSREDACSQADYLSHRYNRNYIVYRNALYLG